MSSYRQKLKLIIEGLIVHEPNQETKLDMLTAIALACQNDEILRASEEVRYELVEGKKIENSLFTGLPGENNSQSAELSTDHEDLGAYGEGMFV